MIAKVSKRCPLHVSLEKLVVYSCVEGKEPACGNGRGTAWLEGALVHSLKSF